jgi:hypothetical protein
MRITALALAFALLLFCPLPCRAESKLVAGDHTYDVLHLESASPVVTWEEGGVRTFVAMQGAEIRQGPVRLAAPHLVVWFDKEQSSRPGVRTATVRVYAEGVEADKGQRRTPARLVEARKVREGGVIIMAFRSTLGFAWNCPLTKSDKRVGSLLLARAEAAARDLPEDTIVEAIPPAGPRERPEVSQLLSAEQVEVFWEQQPVTVVYLGDVHGSYGVLDLRADAAVLWYDTERNVYEVYAEGNVRISRRPEVPEVVVPPEQKPALSDVLEFLSADEIYINPDLVRGLATNAEVRMRDPRAPPGDVVVFRGEKAYLMDSKTMIINEASLTTCDFARPHYRIKADKIQVLREEPSTLATAWNIKFQAGESARTVVSLPFIGTDLTQRAYLLADWAFGSSKRFGTFIQTLWQPLDLTTKPAWIDTWTVGLDYYGARGPAVGTDFVYESPGAGYPHHQGRVTAFYISDSGTTDATGQPVPQTGRGRFHLEHRTQVNRDWRLDAEYYWLSDAGFLQEYFLAEAQEQKTPESYVLARYLRNSTYLALLYKWQTNSFITDVEQKPSLDLEVIGLPVGRLVYDASVVTGLYDFQFSDQLAPAPPDPPSLGRFHTQHRLSLPFSIGIVRLDPSVEALVTWASKSAGPGGTFAGAISRAGLGAGITASTTFSRIFDVRSERFDLNRLRHVVTPYVSVQARTVSEGSAKFIQMDAIDAIDTGTEVRVGARQRLETKRLKDGLWQPVEWVKLDVALVAGSSDSVNPALGQEYVLTDFNMLLTDHVSLHSHDSRLALDNNPSLLNLGATFNYLPRWGLSVDFDSITGKSTTLTVDLIYQLSERYQLLLLEQYGLKAQSANPGKSLQTAFIIRRVMHDWVLDLGVRVDKSRNEVALVFGLGPKAFNVLQTPRWAGR